MSASEILEQIRRLPPAEQYEVAEKIWEEFGDFDDDLTPEQIAELDRRAERALAHPECCRPLDDLIADMEKRFRARQ
jgi:putative addiction module component (TIGR02574 family)